MLFTAKKAKAVLAKYKNQNLNYQRIYILERIKNAANMGLKSVCIDDPHIQFFPEDYSFFESLGYDVIWGGKANYSEIRDKKEYTIYRIGYINW
jgi:DNA polymerase III alpha subunit (gram-positive type)